MSDKPWAGVQIETIEDREARRIRERRRELREWYAGMAMQAMFNGFRPGDNRAPDVYRVCAREAFAVADAMIEAGNTGEDKQ